MAEMKCGSQELIFSAKLHCCTWEFILFDETVKSAAHIIGRRYRTDTA